MVYNRFISDKKYYEKNKNKIKFYLKSYYKKNKIKIKKNSLKNYYLNKNLSKIKKHLYYEKNKEYFKQKSYKYRIKNKQKLSKYLKKYNIQRRKKDFNFNMRHRLRSRLNIVLKKFGNGKRCPANKYGIDYEAIIEHLKPFPKYLSKYHVDHIKPLFYFDLTDPEQIKEAFSPENHQWLLAEDNLKKGKKLAWQNSY